MSVLLPSVQLELYSHSCCSGCVWRCCCHVGLVVEGGLMHKWREGVWSPWCSIGPFLVAGHKEMVCTVVWAARAMHTVYQRKCCLGYCSLAGIMCSGCDGGKALHWSLQGPAACGAWMFALRGIPRVHHPKPQDEHHAVCTLSAIGHTSLHAAGMCLSCRTCCTCTSNRCGPRANSIHSMQHFGGQWWCWCCETRWAVSTLGCLIVGR